MKWCSLWLCLMLAACSGNGAGPDAGFDPDADPYPPDAWDPGDPDSDPCAGDGGADGGGDGCVAGPVDCARDDCVHGECIDVPGGADWCDCHSGYAGMLCDRCAAGYVAVGLECVPAGGCADSPCVHGTCRPLQDGDFRCDCDAGYAGRLCDRCAEGYHVEDLRCVPD